METINHYIRSSWHHLSDTNCHGGLWTPFWFRCMVSQRESGLNHYNHECVSAASRSFITLNIEVKFQIKKSLQCLKSHCRFVFYLVNDQEWNLRIFLCLWIRSISTGIQSEKPASVYASDIHPVLSSAWQLC